MQFTFPSVTMIAFIGISLMVLLPRRQLWSDGCVYRSRPSMANRISSPSPDHSSTSTATCPNDNQYYCLFCTRHHFVQTKYISIVTIEYIMYSIYIIYYWFYSPIVTRSSIKTDRQHSVIGTHRRDRALNYINSKM